MRAPVFVLVGAAAWSGPSAANPWARLPRMDVAEHASPALETCLRNCRLAEENRVIAPSIDKLGNNLEYFTTRTERNNKAGSHGSLEKSPLSQRDIKYSTSCSISEIAIGARFPSRNF